MTLYAESSAVLRWLFAEPGGEDARAALSLAEKVATSRLTLIEVRRVVGRAEREGRLAAAQAIDLLALFARAASSWAIVELVPSVAQRAAERFPAEPVRTLDAIHLATALFLRPHLPELVLLTSDERIRRNAALLGLEVRPPDRKA